MYAAGDIHRAQSASVAAGKYFLISLVLGILLEVGLVVFSIVSSNTVAAGAN